MKLKLMLKLLKLLQLDIPPHRGLTIAHLRRCSSQT